MIALASTPVLAVLVYLGLTAAKHSDTASELEAVKHELRQERFDREWARFSGSLGVTPLPSSGEQTPREVELQTQRTALEAERAAERQDAARHIGEVDAAARANPELKRLIEEQQK